MASAKTLPQQAQPLSGQPSRWVLMRWGGVVLAFHLLLLLNMAGTINWQLKSSPMFATAPLQTRMIPTGATEASAPQGNNPVKTESSRTRIAIERVSPRPAPAAQQALARPSSLAPSPTAATPPDVSQGTSELTPPLEQASAVTPATGTPPQPEPIAPSPPATEPTSMVLAEPAPAADKLSTAEGPPPQKALSVANADTPPAPAAPIANATLVLPSLPLAAIPPSVLLSYRLQGQEKGLNYSASGELRWQRNNSAYAMSLSVKALLLGSRYWRSQGLLTAEGLAPVKFSDSWRSERVTHFDQPTQRIVFSSNAPTVPLQAGAQDQVSLYVQLAAAMAQQSTPLPVGTRLQIQTATVRDALPWLLTLEKTEILQLDGISLPTTQWVCHPRNRFDAKVEFWVAAEYDWLPVRIRITQTTGSFIDLQLTGRTSLPELPPSQTPG
jgi:hypothetical protein